MQFRGKIWTWRGPSPYFFVTVPDRQARDLRAVAKLATYGWGMIPVVAQIRRTTWNTSLFPKDGTYVVPLKDAVRAAERIGEGDRVTIRLRVR